MSAIVVIIVGLAGLLVGGGAGLAFGLARRRQQDAISLQDAEEKANRILVEAESQQKELLLRAKEETLEMRNSLEQEIRGRRSEVTRLEERLVQREENLDRKSATLERREDDLKTREDAVDRVRAEAEEIRARQLEEIQRISGLTREQARSELMAAIEDEVRDEAGRRVREMEKQVESTASMRARSILATAIQRYTAEVTAETTVSVVPIPSDEMKGRIIGREGRNIRAIEAATGVDVIIDDTPDAITVSAFDPVRREIARVALSNLVQDGRIHPTRIEEAVARAKREVESTMQEAAEAAAVEAGVLNLHPEVLKVFGRLRYRTSYGQNVMRHSVETGHIAAMIAREIGADVDVARTGGFLHDLGKAIDHEVEGTHAILGAQVYRRFRGREEVAHCIEAHHEEVPPHSVEAVIVMMADAVSGGRPGARRESLDAYIKRLETLETIATSRKGVEAAFAIQAGRELRIIVKPEAVDDLEAMRIARDVSQQIEETMEYPGQIKVTVVRETRATEYAR
jgi:ribonuclease Y